MEIRINYSTKTGGRVIRRGISFAKDPKFNLNKRDKYG